MLKTKLTKTQIATAVVVKAVEYSASFTVATIAHTLCPTSNNLQKAKLVVGAYTLGAVAGEKAGAYINDQIETVVATVKKAKAEAQTASA